MAAEFYRIVHFVGIMLVFMSLGGLCLHVMNSGDKESNKFRKIVAITHGVGLVLILVAGFGMLAKYKMPFMESAWIWPKLLVWFILGGFTVILYRAPAAAKFLWAVLPVLGLVAAFFAVYKPI
jgi:uncharacterized membrane protein SirB2